MTGPTLTTERLVLTPVSAADFDDHAALWSDKAFAGPLMGRTLEAEDVWFRLLRDIGGWAALGYGNFSLRLKADGAYVGGVGVFDYRRNLDPPFADPEAGWGLAPAFHGQGLALEALTAVLAWADQAVAAPHTVCMIAPSNTASLRLAARVGYRPYHQTRYRDAPIVLLQRPRAAGGDVGGH